VSMNLQGTPTKWG